MKFRQVDVFTKVPFLGNPVAVVIGAEGLDAEAMQRIACWTNLSETTFLLGSDKADYRLRIFTPRAELPFAGHPTIGSAHAALEAGFVPKKAVLTQECAAGLIELRLEDDRIFLKGPPPELETLDVDPSAVGIPLKPASSLVRVAVGPVWLVGEMSDARALAALKPDMSALAEWTASLKATGVTVFAKSDDCVAALHVRSFAPAHGIPEDPVCGSGNLAVASVFHQESSYTARQGGALGRDGRVFIRKEKDATWLGGSCVTCVEGEIRTS
ncbi:MAG TPA: PhzF family phenazine biosynthesis protein [Burkholderiales bacterium]|nr:PhzF family phenazine biosynthesis protein [Burkholderiales bacterium]